MGNPHRALLGKLERVDREGGRAPRIAIDDEFRLGADDLGACAWVVSARKQQVPCARVFPARNRRVQCRVLGDPRANQVPETTTSRRGDPRDMGVSLSHASPPSGSQEGTPRPRGRHVPWASWEPRGLAPSQGKAPNISGIDAIDWYPPCHAALCVGELRPMCGLGPAHWVLD